MDSVDVLVVGSGPAGSTAARFAAEKGASVMFIERRPEVGVPVRCGEFMPGMGEIMDMFPNLTDADEIFDIPQELRCLDTVGIKLVNPKGKVTLLDFEGYTTDRDRFDQYLARQAQEAGAVLETSCLFKGIRDGVAETSKGDIKYKVIIGADGPGSRVAQSLGLNRNRNPYPAVTAQVKGDFEPYLYMFFGDIAPGAYSWIIPKDGRANVGVGFSPRFAHGNLGEYFDTFARKNGFEEHSKLEGKYVPSEGPIAKTVSGNGMVVGDAAGQVISVNGGGIPLALIAGRVCGRVAAANIASSSPLADYETEWRRIMEKPLKTAASNKKLADTFAFRSEFSTNLCMGILGKRRMGNLIRCKRIFPRSLLPVPAHRRPAYRAFRHLLLEPLAASDALVVPSGDLRDALHADRLERYAEHAADVLYGVVVAPDLPVHVERQSNHGDVNGGQPPAVACFFRCLHHLLHGCVGAVGDADHVGPECQAGVLVDLQLPDDSRRADVVALGQRIH